MNCKYFPTWYNTLQSYYVPLYGLFQIGIYEFMYLDQIQLQ